MVPYNIYYIYPLYMKDEVPMRKQLLQQAYPLFTRCPCAGGPRHSAAPSVDRGELQHQLKKYRLNFFLSYSYIPC